MARRNSRGLTLLEITIASALLIALTIMAFATIISGVSRGDNATRESELAGRGRQTLDRIRAEIQYSHLLSDPNPPITTDFASIRYQLPINATGANYGYYNVDFTVTPPVLNPTLTSGWCAEISFEGYEIYRESNSSPVIPANLVVPGLGTAITWPTTGWRVLDGSDDTTASPPRIRVTGSDLNGDGDQGDAFVVGRLVLRVYNSDTSTLPLATFNVDDQIVLAPSTTNTSVLTGDVDGDGTTDPLFALLSSTGASTYVGSSTPPARLRTTLWHVKLDEDGRRFIKRKNQEDVKLENPQ